jgi:hypothetical protein
MKLDPGLLFVLLTFVWSSVMYYRIGVIIQTDKKKKFQDYLVYYLFYSSEGIVQV